MSNYRFDTVKVRGGYRPKEHHDAAIVPIYATASYEVGEAERFDRIASFNEVGYLYSRLGNPTNSVLEERITQLEGGVDAVALSSGMAAITATLLALCEGGGRILTTHQLYGGTIYHLDKVLTNFGITIDKVKNSSPVQEYEKLIQDNTKAIFVESISNPNNAIADIEELAKLAHKHHIPLVVDNTFATPYLFHPFEFGADIVIYSATKAINGHGSAIAGLIVDSGNFNWATSGKFPQFDKTSFVLKDIDGRERTYNELFKKAAFMGKIKIDYLVNFGSVLSPFESYLVLIGLETLSERVSKQISNAKKIIEFLQKHEAVEWISYPSLEGNPYKALADKYFAKGPGSVFSFGFKGTKEQIYKLINSVELFSYQANVGDARSLIVNVPNTTHGELNEEELALADIPLETIRLSIGIEDPQDLIEDLKQAFEKALE